MIERNKVIEWLDFCIRNTDGSICNCEMSGCPYLGGSDVGNCFVTLMTDALALLKAQEPRVMTLEEIKALPDYVFLEDRDISHAFSIKTISRPALPQLVFVNTSDEECMGFRGPDGDTILVTSRYGVKWRCWTSRPTDAQREAAKWE